MEKKSDSFSMQEAMRLAQSDAGQQLLHMLQQNHGNAAKLAWEQAQKGDMQQAQKTLQAFLSDPQTRALLQKLKEDPHG